jgi:hypothetical protein
MTNISKWVLERNGSKNGIPVFRVRAEGTSYCPYEKIYLLIQRLMCKSCMKIHHQLPDCIVPYKRFSLGIIEGIISQPDEATLIDEETVKRILTWWALMVAYILGVAPSLTEKHQVAITPGPKTGSDRLRPC